VSAPITEEDLQAYVDSALSAARHDEVKAYLEQHPEIGRRIDGLVRQRAALRAALAPIAEEPVPSRLSLARLAETQGRGIIGTWRSLAAAILLLGLGGTGGWLLNGVSRPAESGIASVAAEAADSYAVFAPDTTHPVELRAADGLELASWLSARLHRPIAAPDLAVEGYRYMGGRLVATPHGPAGLFMYDDDHGSRLVVLARLMETERDAPMAEYARGAAAGFAWADQGMGYSLVGPATATTVRLRALANEVRAQLRQST
jgi:anti-sigma factor RsiW